MERRAVVIAEIFVGSVSVGVVPDAKGWNEELRRQLLPSADNIGREYGSKLGRGIQESVRVYTERIKEDLRRGFDVNVDADTTSASEHIDAMRKEQERNAVNIPVRADQSSIRNFGRSLAQNIRQGFVNAGLGVLVGLGVSAGGSGLLAGGSALISMLGPLGAATVGIASFAAVAVPQITKVEKALKKTGDAGKQAWKDLTPQERQIGRAFKSVEEAFHDVQKAVAPAVDKVIAIGAGVAKDLMPQLARFARVGARVLTDFIRPFDRWISSRAFNQISKEFAVFAKATGEIVGPGLVQLLRAFSRMFLQLLPFGLQMLKQFMPFLVQFVKAFGQLFLALAPAGLQIMSVLLPAIVKFIIYITPGVTLLAQITANVLSWLHAHHLLLPVLVATLGIIVVLMGVSGLGGIIAATVLVVIAVSALARNWQRYWQNIKNWTRDAWDFMTKGWGQWLIPGLTLIRKVVELLRAHWRDVWSAIKTVTGAVVSFIFHLFKDFLGPAIFVVQKIVGVFQDHWRGAWGAIKGAALQTWNFLWQNILQPFIHLFRNDLPDSVSSAVRIIGRVWNTLKSIFGGPVRFLVNTVYDNGIARLWNAVMGHIGGPQLPLIHLATGGRIPGYGGGDIQPALLEPGETVIDKVRSRALAPIFRAAGVPGYQDGGIIGGIGGFFGNLFHGAGDVVKIIAALTTGNATAAENAFGDLFHTPAHGDLAKMMLGIPKAIVHTAVNFVIHSLDSLLGGSGKGISSGVAGYAGIAKEVLALLGQPIADYVIVLSQIMSESGGNAFAVNKSDINWLMGTPSVGALQVIGPTFAANAGPFRNVGPFMYGVSVNKLANVYAGMHYAVDRYGPAPGGWDAVLGHGHGYDDGGWWPSGTFGWNTSGQAEYVLTQDKMRQMGGTNYHAHFDGMTLQTLQHEVRHSFKLMEISEGALQRHGRRN